MTNDQVQQIISALLDATFLDDWYFYLILFSVSLLGGLAGAYLKSYGSEKAKYAAIQSSLNKIKDKIIIEEKAKYEAIEESLETIKQQVAITTETSEKIKTALDHGNWRKKELETFKRQKLEEYGSLILQIEPALSNAWLKQNSTNELKHGVAVILQAQLIQILYLPELSNSHDEFFKVAYTCIDNIENSIHDKLDVTNQDAHNAFEKLVGPIHLPRKELLDEIRFVAQQLNQ